MKKTSLKFDDFNTEKLSKNEQKIIRGGDGDTDLPNPSKGGGGAGNV
ncbi:rSAM-modified peptide [Flavobacterium procerum]|uniref:RSAM-modified peptide n=1 Tax=Flavobacterium procerum TaxID=1455569 RepID=A0ABV6BT63_9FLAO